MKLFFFKESRINRSDLEASNEIGIYVNAFKKRIQRAKEKIKDAIVEEFL